MLPVRCLSEIDTGDHFDLVLVPVRAEQLSSTLPLLTTMNDGSDVLFFGNVADHQAELTAALGGRALFGFPAAGGTRDGSLITYVLISRQKTMLGEPEGTTTPRIRRLHAALGRAGLPTRISTDIGGWLVAHGSSSPSPSPSTASASTPPGSPRIRTRCG